MMKARIQAILNVIECFESHINALSRDDMLAKLDEIKFRLSEVLKDLE